MKYRGKYIDKDGMKCIIGEDREVKIQEEISTVIIKDQYVIWDSLEKLISVNEHTGEEIWSRFK